MGGNLTDSFHFDSLLIQQAKGKDGETFPSLNTATGFEYDSPEDLEAVFQGQSLGFLYSRISNPNAAALEEKLRQLDKAQSATVFASGMATMSALIDALCESGDHIIATTHMFGGTFYLLEEIAQQQKIKVTYVDTHDLEALEKAIQPDTKAIFCESIGNPRSDVAPLKGIVKIAQAHQIPTVLDNTVPTPYCVDAKALGIDIVWYSLSKWYGGMGLAVGGAALDLGNYNWKHTVSPGIENLYKQFGSLAFSVRLKKLVNYKGSFLSPFSAWMILQGIQTLSVRMRQHCENATLLCNHLEKNHSTVKVNFPNQNLDEAYQIFKNEYRGALFSLEMKDKASCYALIRHLKLVKNVTNIGDVRSLVIYPADTIYRNVKPAMAKRMGVSDSLLRFSVGIENIEDLKKDFDQALQGGLS